MHTIAEVGTNVPAFLGKLWKMVEDPITNDLISWSTSGSSFVIHDQARFARELLPMYYKHNNMASFIRQLNMYGFHKIVSVDAGSLKQEFDEIKFKHPFFVRGHPYLLEHIKRKMTVNKMSLAPGEKTNNVVNKVLSDVRHMKGRQETMDSRLAAMKLENEALWRELSVLRQKHLKQQQIVNKLIQFLVTLVQPTHNLSMKRRNTPLMLRDRANRSPNTKPTSQSPMGPVIHELDPAEVLLDDVLPETDPVLSEEEDSILSEGETILPDAGPDSTSPITNYFTIEDVENDVLPDSVVDPAEEEDFVDLENLPAHFLTVDVQPVSYKNIIGNKVVNSPRVQHQQPSPGVTSVTANKRQPAAGVSKQRRPRTTKTRKRRKSSGGGDNNTLVFSSVDSSSQQQVGDKLQMDSNGEYPTVVIDVPVNNINNIRMILPQNRKKVQQPVVAATSPLLTGKNKDNPIEEPPIILDDITADMLVQPTDNSSVVDAATSTTPSPPIVENMNLDVIQADLTNSLNSPSVSNSELDMQIACKDPAKNASSQLDSWGQHKERMTNGIWCGGKNRLEMDNHVECVQSDLDSLKELLRSENLSLDANTLLGIFNTDDDPMNYLGDPVHDNGKFKETPAGNEVIAYSPALFDLADMLNGNDWSLPDSSVIDDPTTANDNSDDNNSAAKDTSFCEVNTPQFIMNSPSFPTPAKKRKK